MNEEKSRNDESDGGALKLPLWKSLADQLIDSGLEYGQRFETSMLESKLKASRDTQQFHFAMMKLRAYIEDKTDKYIAQVDAGHAYTIPSAPGTEDVSARLDRQVKTSSVRAVRLRSAVLCDPKAVLTDEERANMEKNLEHASMRLVLLNRAKAFVALATEHSPKLLRVA